MCVDSTQHSSINLIHVLTLEPLNQQDTLDIIQSISAHESTNQLEWNISNKYYNATTRFKLVNLNESIDRDDKDDVQAVLILTPFTKIPSNHLRLIVNRYSQEFENVQVSLIVTLGSKHDEKNQPDDDADDQDEWDDLMITNGFEWIQLEHHADDSHDDDQEGIERIKQALHANVWQHMTMKTNQQPYEHRVVGDDDDDGQQDDEETCFDLPSLPQAKPYVPLQVSFPNQFLPLIPRKNKDQDHQVEFEDDFNPFVSATTTESKFNFDSFENIDEVNQDQRQESSTTRQEFEEQDEVRIQEFENMFKLFQSLKHDDERLERDEPSHDELNSRRDRAEMMLMQLLQE
ncbi:hypothetical protein OIO90_004854 [Microbotryomycetes sp. JL221]|nr:hypothetical protein OIO90_004854 [Microbotryomycetes sp. JL221]